MFNFDGGFSMRHVRISGLWYVRYTCKLERDALRLVMENGGWITGTYNTGTICYIRSKFQ